VPNARTALRGDREYREFTYTKKPLGVLAVIHEEFSWPACAGRDYPGQSGAKLRTNAEREENRGPWAA